MKWAFSFLLAFTILTTSAQFGPGYEVEEARDMVALCNSFTFLKEEGSDSEILPKGYKRIYASPSMGMDNQFQVYVSGNSGVLVFRGSTASPTSWMANIYASMIPAQGEISIAGTPRPYRFADNTGAAVHSGYALATVILANEVLQQVTQLNKRGIRHIYITGHSQGGSLAQMVRAYLENLPAGEIEESNTYKTYAFAPPMIGDKSFAAEYNQRFSSKETSFTIINPGDPVPLFPSGMDGDGGGDAIQMFSGGEPNDFRSMMMAFLFQSMNDTIAGFANQMGQNLLATLSNSMGEVKMPASLSRFEYQRTGKVVEIEPMDFPEIPNKIQDPEAPEFVPEPGMYQHKPYVYYQSILKTNFPNEFNRLKRELPPGM